SSQLSPRPLASQAPPTHRPGSQGPRWYSRHPSASVSAHSSNWFCMHTVRGIWHSAASTQADSQTAVPLAAGSLQKLLDVAQSTTLVTARQPFTSAHVIKDWLLGWHHSPEPAKGQRCCPVHGSAFARHSPSIHASPLGQ